VNWVSKVVFRADAIDTVQLLLGARGMMLTHAVARIVLRLANEWVASSFTLS
jgi:hypothetical protein